MSGTHLDPASASTASSISSRPSADASEGRKVSFQQPRPTATSSRSSSSAYLATSGTSGSSQTGASSQAYSAYSGVTRRHSLFGTEDRIVLDIGSRYSKFGFSGEPRPRAIVLSVSFAQPSTSYLQLDTSSSNDPYSIGDTLWDLDFERCTDDQLRRGKRALLLAQLTQLLRNAFTQHLMVDPKQRKVLVVENPMLPTSVKEMICKVLFNNLQVPSVSFVPAPLLSLLAVGRITGLVLEVGYLEATLMPVYYGRPLTSHTVSSSRAGKRLNDRLRRLLLRYGKFVAAQNGLQDSAKSLKERTHAIDPTLLTDERLVQIKAKALFVSSHDPALEGMQELFSVLEHEPSNAATQATLSHAQKEVVRTIRQKYSAASSTTPFTFAINPESVDPNGTASLVQSVQAPPSTSASTLTPASASSQKTPVSGVIAIPGWVRDRAAELLFEQGDPDDPGIIDMTVSAISKLPIDLRRVMCESVLVSGGTAMLPGFANRFRTQLALAIEKAEQAGGELSIDRHSRRLKPALELKDKQGQVGGSKLHRSVAVLNDPWPSQNGKIGGQGGSAPAFAANLLAWMGASLAGALKTTALNAISREAYDEATKAVQDEAEAAQDSAEKEKEKEKENLEEHDRDKGVTASRPAISAASKRGSFVGVVGGLETGAYGGLAAVSRHLIGIPGGAGSSSSGASQGKSATLSSTTGSDPSGAE